MSQRRLIALIDGEHHPAAVGDALASVNDEAVVVAVVFCGGSEKVPQAVLDDPVTHYGFPLVRGDGAVDALGKALAATSGADGVIDLADEPVLPLSEKLRLASMALAAGLTYEAPGMSLKPMHRTTVDFAGPKLAVIGTGKRTGKTAVCGHLAMLLKDRGVAPAIVSMGRGGPAEPQVARPDTGLADLLEIARSGIHAASDYLEDAVLAGVPTVGCRRVGGGPAGETAFTNFAEGAAVAARLPGIDALLFEGSGASVPPVEADRTICITGSLEQADLLTGPLRLIESDLVLVHAGDPELLEAAAKWCDGQVVAFELEPTVAEPLPDDAVSALFTTGAHQVSGADPVVHSANLARRAELEHDLEAAALAGCTHYLTEIKAAGIDTVAMHADRVGAKVVFVCNRPVGVGCDLDAVLEGEYAAATGTAQTTG
ncbi:MAG: hypothetical protein HZB14_03560 [Actinobacteria bacterium]|nr:hypothetical protein [Actinomycetota bacterium]